MSASIPRFFCVVAVIAVTLPTPAHANAPAGRYVVTNSGTANGTVYDTKTKLTWQQTIASGTYDWAGAKTYCAGLSLNGIGWRLPTCKELQTIVDDSRTNPSIDATAFPSTPADWFWSSSPLAGSSSYAWSVYFSAGHTFYDDVSYNNFLVRCVR
jgi:Protein of unknown function (DUF1566)